MDISKAKLHFTSQSDEELQWFKEQYEFDVYIEEEGLIIQEEKSGAKTFLKLVNEEIEFREDQIK